jgi:predicted amidohydrolase
MAVGQPMVVPGDVAGNLLRIERIVVKAADRGARLILFSEDAINGYDHHGVGARSAVLIDSAEISKLRDLATKNRTTIVAGFFERQGTSIYNSAAIAQPDGSLLVQRKHEVTQLEVRTGGVMAGPRERVRFTVDGLSCAVLICADGGIKGIHEELAATGCEVILAPTAGLGSDEHVFHQSELSDQNRLAQYLKAAASVCFISPEMSLKYDMALVCCNQMGYSAEHRYFHPGHACVMDRTGEITALIPGRFVAEHLREDWAVGFVTRGSRSSAESR